MPDSSPSQNHPQADSDLSGLKLGNYQLLRRLGRGGMADVYLAEQLSLRRQVAFKVLKRTLAEDQAYVRRFHNEARAAASLVHANIVQIHEVGCIDGNHFIAQEYVAGQNLKQWLTRHRTADAKTAVHIMRQVVAALSRASQQGIIHRDIKPENIMLAKTGEVKVADFGLARVASDGQGVGLTQVGVTLGTPLYMSPEQVEGRTVDPRSDLYSFGVTCYEMLSGRPPFEGETPLSVAVQHLRSEPPRLENQRPDLPDGLCRIVHRLLAKSPTDRFQSPADVMRDLRALCIDGLEEWPAGIDDWDTPELLALSDARSEATVRLESIMKSHAKANKRRTLGWRLALPVFLGLFLGAAGAWLNKPANLLTVEATTVEHKKSAMLQYWHAVGRNTEDAWRAVGEYFDQKEPMNRVYAMHAKRRLAELYRDKNEPEKAMTLYRELADLGLSEPQFTAHGLIGQANLLAQEGAGEANMERATGKLAEAVPLLKDLPEEQVRIVLQCLDSRLLKNFAEVSVGEDKLQGVVRDMLPSEAEPAPKGAGDAPKR